jgi:hypothetical protein
VTGPLQRAIFSEDGALGPIGKAVMIIGQPTVGLQALVMSSSLGHSLKSLFRKYEHPRLHLSTLLRSGGAVVLGDSEPVEGVAAGGCGIESPTSALTAGITSSSSAGMLFRSPPQQRPSGTFATEITVSNTSAGRPAETPSSESAIAGEGGGPDTDMDGCRMSSRARLVFSLGRMLITPALQMLLNYVMLRTWLGSRDKLLLMIVMTNPTGPR